MASSAPSTSLLERALLFGGAVVWVVAAVHPADRSVWLLENILLAVGVVWIVATYRKWRLSPSSHILIFVFFAIHVVGAHYTYSAVPIGEWLRPVLGTQRNHYDRIVHFLFGLLLVGPFRDQIGQAMRLRSRAAWFVSFLSITSLSTAYELMEWITASLVDPNNVAAFLAMQGDIFDSQKDMALAIVGASIGLTAAWIYGRITHLMRTPVMSTLIAD